MPGTRKLGKPTDQRMAMLRQQVTDLLDKGRMETTVNAPLRPAEVIRKYYVLEPVWLRPCRFLSYKNAPRRACIGGDKVLLFLTMKLKKRLRYA